MRSLLTILSLTLLSLSIHAGSTTGYLKNKIFPNDPRYSTMKTALDYMEERQPKILVETGTSRNIHQGLPAYAGDGGSTDIFGSWAKNNGSLYYSVDISPQSISNAFQVVGSNENVILVCHDSISFLRNFNQPIDFLYLDSYDFEWFNPTPSQEHHLKEIEAALPFLHDNSVVMIDDCNLPHGGKGALVIPFLLDKGWKVASQGYQVILTK